MTEERAQRAKRIFLDALEVAPDRRPGFLEQACAGDDELRRRVEQLLDAHAAAGPFLAEPAEPEPETPGPQDDDVGRMLGPYKALERIGEGGFGMVYMAEQTEPVRRMVALKILKRGMDSKEVLARFEAERHALAMMDHPNIAKVLDAGTTPRGRPYFVMELVRGMDITRYCDQARVSMSDRVTLMEKVCRAVQHAHQKGIIHRDIKPSNVLVTLHDGEPVPKVIDFGVAKAIGHRLTEKTLFTGLHQMIGTPEYMAPEQAELSDLDIDTRADIYALGVLTYELLTGTKPLDLREMLRAGLAEILRHIREVEPPRPSTRISTMDRERLVAVAERRGVPPTALRKLMRGDLDWIVMKALEKDRTRRYETAVDLANDLARYRLHEPVAARAPSAAYRLRKFVRRHKVAVGAAGAVALSLLAGMVLAAEGYVAAARSAAEARAERDATKEALRQAEGGRLASLASDHVASDPSLALLLALEAARLSGRPAVRSVVLSALGSHFEAATLFGHDAYVTDARFDPSGQRALTVAQEPTALIWDIATRRVLHRLAGHAREVRWGEFDGSGGRVLTASADGTARVWDAATGRTTAVLEGSGAELHRARFSPSGALVVTCPADGALRVFDAATGAARHVLAGHSGDVVDACWIGGDARLASVAADGTLRIWDVAAGSERHVLPAGLRSLPGRVAYGDDWVWASPDGRRLFTGLGEAWDAGSGEPVPMPALRGARFLDLSRSTTRAMVALEGESDAGLVEIRDVESGTPIARLPAEVRGARFADDEGQVVTAQVPGGFLVYDGETGGLVARCQGHRYQVWRMRLAPGRRLLLSASADGTARLWDLGRADRRAVLRSLTGGSPTVRVQPAREVPIAVVSARSAAGAARHVVVDLHTGEVLREVVTSRGAPRAVGDLARAGSGLVVIDAEDRVGVFDITTGTTTQGFALPPGSLRQRLSPDGRWLGVVCPLGDEPAWRVFDAATGAPLGPPGVMPDDKCGAFQCTSDGRMFLTAHSEALPVVILWDVQTGRELDRFVGHTGFIEALEITPDGTIAATRGKDDTMRTWDLVNRRPIAVCRGIPMEAGREIVLSDDGRHVAALAGELVLIHDARTGEALARIQAAPTNRSWVVSGRWSPDGETLLTFDSQGSVRSWPLDAVAEGEARLARELTPAERSRFDIGTEADRDAALRAWAEEHVSSRAFSAWGERCIELGDLDAANTAFERAIELNAESAEAHLGHAVVHALRAAAAGEGERRREEVDSGLRALDLALEYAAPGRVYDPKDRRLEILRADPRCAEILRRHGR